MGGHRLNSILSEVDLVLKQGQHLKAFEIKWRPRRTAGRAFRAAYGVEVESIQPENPFTMEIFESGFDL